MLGNVHFTVGYEITLDQANKINVKKGLKATPSSPSDTIQAENLKVLYANEPIRFTHP